MVPSSANAVISNLDGSLKIFTSEYLAGAISAIVFQDKQYVYSLGHGSSFQFAGSIDGLGESYNPTEAGGKPDDYILRQITNGNSFSDLMLQENHLISPPWATIPQTQITSSRILEFVKGRHSLASTTQMAYWITRSGQPSHGANGTGIVPGAANSDIISNYIQRKLIRTNAEGNSHLVRIDSTLRIPAYDQDMKNALRAPHLFWGTQFSHLLSPKYSNGLALYFVPEFSKHFEIVDPENSKLIDISQQQAPDGRPYSSSNMMIYASEDQYAMGVYALPLSGTVIEPSYTAYVHGDWCGGPDGAPDGGCNKLDVNHSLSVGAFENTVSTSFFLAFGSVDEVRSILSCVYQKYSQRRSDLDCSRSYQRPAIEVSCKPSFTEVPTNRAMKWTALVRGGKYPLRYRWRESSGGPEQMSLNGSLEQTYQTTGSRSMQVQVEDQDLRQSEWTACDSSVSVIPMFDGTNPRPISIACSPEYEQSLWGYSVKWKARVDGGVPPYTHYWTGDGVSSTTQAIQATGAVNYIETRYSDTQDATKFVGLGIVDARGQTVPFVWCSPSLTYRVFWQSAPLSFECAPQRTAARVGEKVEWTIRASGGMPPYTYYWSGTDDRVALENLSGPTASRIYSSVGTKTMGAAVIDSEGNRVDWKFCNSSVSVLP